jgi:hypothetical protein
MTGADLAARRTMAAALVADFRRNPGDASTPAEWLTWAYRLAEAIDGLLGATIPAAEATQDSARLAEIREILAAFDWELHDRQRALERIDEIAGGAR